jgi:hypothetical protein
MPIEDLRDIYRALEKVPLVDMKYTVIKSNTLEEMLVGE